MLPCYPPNYQIIAATRTVTARAIQYKSIVHQFTIGSIYTNFTGPSKSFYAHRKFTEYERIEKAVGGIIIVTILAIAFYPILQRIPICRPSKPHHRVLLRLRTVLEQVAKVGQNWGGIIFLGEKGRLGIPDTSKVFSARAVRRSESSFSPRGTFRSPDGLTNEQTRNTAHLVQ